MGTVITIIIAIVILVIFILANVEATQMKNLKKDAVLFL